jgi:Tat protein secretion system quality control protein TatD with DNase activity
MSPPDGLKTEILRDGEIGELNHPANIRSVYTFASELYNLPVQELASKVEQNFLRLFTCN